MIGRLWRRWLPGSEPTAPAVRWRESEARVVDAGRVRALLREAQRTRAAVTLVGQGGPPLRAAWATSVGPNPMVKLLSPVGRLPAGWLTVITQVRGVDVTFSTRLRAHSERLWMLDAPTELLYLDFRAQARAPQHALAVRVGDDGSEVPVRLHTLSEGGVSWWSESDAMPSPNDAALAHPQRLLLTLDGGMTLPCSVRVSYVTPRSEGVLVGGRLTLDDPAHTRVLRRGLRAQLVQRPAAPITP